MGAPVSITPAEAAPDTRGQLLSPEFLSKLRQLGLVSRRLFAGRLKGERRTKNRGSSVEFADYRNYVFGDEPRFVDWNTYGRLEKLFLKLFVEEEDLFVYLLVDTSRSMAFGDPPKLLAARRVAAALAYVALVGSDRVAVSGFGTGLRYSMPPKRGRSQAAAIFDFLAGMAPEGGTSLEASAKRFALQARSPGLVIVLSDFLDKAGYAEALKRLLHKRCEIVAIQILDREELEPRMQGDLRLVDCEDGAVAEITVTDRLLRQYRAVARSYCDDLHAFCTRRGITHVLATTQTPFEQLVLRTLKLAGLLR